MDLKRTTAKYMDPKHQILVMADTILTLVKQKQKLITAILIYLSSSTQSLLHNTRWKERITESTATMERLKQYGPTPTYLTDT